VKEAPWWGHTEMLGATVQSLLPTVNWCLVFGVWDMRYEHRVCVDRDMSTLHMPINLFLCTRLDLWTAVCDASAKIAVMDSLYTLPSVHLQMKGPKQFCDNRPRTPQDICICQLSAIGYRFYFLSQAQRFSMCLFVL
jgi:hypothetical protein